MRVLQDRLNKEVYRKLYEQTYFTQLSCIYVCMKMYLSELSPRAPFLTTPLGGALVEAGAVAGDLLRGGRG